MSESTETSTSDEKTGAPEATGSDDHAATLARLGKELEDARKEAASRRVKNKEDVAAAKAETAAEFEAKLAAISDEKAETAVELENARLQTSKLAVALEAIEPAVKDAVLALADLLQGANEDELKAHAEKVSKTLLGAVKKNHRATDPSQGASGSVRPDPGTGVQRLMAAYSAE